MKKFHIALTVIIIFATMLFAPSCSRNDAPSDTSSNNGVGQETSGVKEKATGKNPMNKKEEFVKSNLPTTMGVSVCCEGCSPQCVELGLEKDPKPVHVGGGYLVFIVYENVRPDWLMFLHYPQSPTERKGKLISPSEAKRNYSKDNVKITPLPGPTKDVSYYVIESTSGVKRGEYYGLFIDHPFENRVYYPLITY